MTLFKIQTKKVLAGSDREWSNDWYTETTNFGTAGTVLNLIHACEKAIHQSIVNFTHSLISEFPVSGGAFQTIPHNDEGDIDIDSNSYLPLFNTLRVDLSTGTGRPSPKYFRGPLLEAYVTNGEIDSSYLTIVTTAFDTLFSDLDDAGESVNKSTGGDILAYTIFGFVQMRQLHRRRKKTPAP